MPELVGLSVATSPCSVKTAGVRKVWLIDCQKNVDIVVTNGTLKDEVTDYTVSSPDDLVEMEFTKNKTAYYNQVQSAPRGPVDHTIYFLYESLTPESIYVMNTMITTCCFHAFVELNNGVILFVGKDYEHDTDTISDFDTPLQFQGTINSGTGNNDSINSIFQFVGQGKYFALNTTLVAADLNDPA